MPSYLKSLLKAWLIPVLVGLPGLLPPPAQAQFFGAWMPPGRSVTAEIGLSYSANEQWFCGDFQSHCEPGERDRFSELPVTAEESRTQSFIAKTQVGIWSFLSLTAELPFHRLRYTAESGSNPAFPPLESNGVGDLRLGVRSGTSSDGWAFSGGYAIQFPTGDFSINAFLVPLGAGTRNHEFFAELGRSLWPLAMYLQGGALYRVREPFDFQIQGITVGQFDWGNEVTGYLQGGWNFTGSWWGKVETKVFRSQRLTSTLEEGEGDLRSFWEVTPAVFVEQWGALFEVWTKIPLTGRATPSDPTLGFKVSYRLEPS